MGGLIASAFMLLFVVIVGTLIRIKNSKRISLIDWAVIGLGAYGGVILLILCLILEQGFSEYLKRKIDIDPVLWSYPLFAIVAVLGLWLSSLAFKPRGSMNAANLLIETKTVSRLQLLAWFFLASGAISYWMYAKAYGGFSGLIQYGAVIRAGLTEEFGFDLQFAFLKRFGGFVFFSCLLFSALLFSKASDRRISLGVLVGFVASLLSSMFVLYTWQGRLLLLVFPCVIALGFIIARYGYRPKNLSRILVVLLIPVFVFPATVTWWGKKNNESHMALAFVDETQFPLVSFGSMMKYHKYHYMSDVAITPLYLLPQRIWRDLFHIRKPSTVNTENVVGAAKGERGNLAEVPIDFVSLGVLQGHLLGVLLLAVVFGFLLGWLDKWILNSFTGGLAALFYSYSAMFVAIFSSVYADPQHIVIRNFHFIVGLFFTYLIVTPSVRRGRRLARQQAIAIQMQNVGR